MRINRPLIEFGSKNPAITYQLLLAIEQRRERKEARARRIQKVKDFFKFSRERRPS